MSFELTLAGPGATSATYPGREKPAMTEAELANKIFLEFPRIEPELADELAKWLMAKFAIEKRSA